MISECNKIDELMMDFIYQELEPAAAADVKSHVDGCARCGAELASLSRTRQAMRSLADVEPPAGVSALLLHEAAKRKPAAAASSEGGGIWAAILRFFGPIQAHPAMAAVASIVLVAGIAGYLSKRGHVSDKTPAISEAASDDSLKLQPKGGLEVRLDGDVPGAAPNDVVAGAPAPEGGAGGELDRAQAGEKSDSTRRGIAADDARERWGSLASKEEQKALEAPKKKASKGDALDDYDGVVSGDANHMGGAGATSGAYGSVGYSTPPTDRKAENAPKPEPSKLRALDQENTVPPARPRAAQGEDAWSREESEAASSMAQGETRQTKDGGRVASKPSEPAAAPPPAPVTSTATTTPGLAQPQAQAPSQTKTPARAPSGAKQQTASSTQVHNEAAKKAKSGSCAEALAMRSRLYKSDPSYYDKAVRTDRSFDSCLTAEQRKRAKPASRDKAMDEAAPTQTDQKTVKQSAQ